MTTFSTERLTLKVLSGEQAPLLQEYLLNNRTFHKPWEPTRDDAYYALDSCGKLLEFEQMAFENKTSLPFYLFEKNGQHIIGKASLTNIVYGPFQSCFLGYGLDAMHLHQGFMTEALKKILVLAFSTYGLHRVEANIMPRNAESRKLVQGLGFREEGLSTHYLQINGIWEDHLHYVLLNE